MSKKRRKGSALKKASNTRSRRSVIEADYVNGVYDKNGKQVIRPLNEEEKEWLERYYEETVVTNFLHGKGMREKSGEIKNILECDEYKKLAKEQKGVTTHKEKNRIKELKKLLKEQNLDNNAEEVAKLKDELQDLRDQHLLYPDPEDHKTFYKENNKRNVDALNNGRIEEFTPEIMDKLYLEAQGGVDMEDVFIYNIEGDTEEEE